MSSADDEREENTVESTVLRFSGFISGIFLFFWFLQSMENNQLFLFLAFVGLGMGLHMGFTAWEGFTGVRKRVRKSRERFK